MRRQIRGHHGRTSRYPEVYARWQRDPQGFWGEAADAIDWIEKPKTVFDPNAGVYGRWFPDGVCNTCYNAVDRHVDRRPRHAARDHLRLAGHRHEADHHLRRAADQDRDRSPASSKRTSASPRATASSSTCRWCRRRWSRMLACARIGAVHSVVFGGFAPKELATRIDDAKPKVILSASCGIEAARVIPYKPLLDEAIDLAKHKPDACLILQRPQLHVRADARPRPRLAEDLGRGAGVGQERARAGAAAAPPIRSTSSTPRAPPASRRAWCATTAATWSR